jgi:CPA2 family monovalent cation:H+ antiporter-2
MLLDPFELARQIGPVLALTVVVILVKVLVGLVVVLAFRRPLPTAVMTAVLLAQVGEFSFVLAALAVQREALPAAVQLRLLATAALSIAATPALLAVAPRLTDWLARLPWFGPRLAARDALPMTEPAAESLRRHVIVAGYGRVGRELVDALRRRNLSVVVIDRDPRKVAAVRAAGLLAVYGDASLGPVLEAAALAKARLLAVTMPDGLAAEQTVRAARAHHPDVEIAARGDGPETIARLWSAGARALVQPEFEAGLAFVAHTLRRVGLDSREVSNLIAGRRRSYYDIDGADTGHVPSWE